jgi:hypothetical protein
MPVIVLHDKQLDRVLKDYREVKDNSFFFGFIKAINYVLFLLEAAALAFAAYHGIEGFSVGVVIALAVEVSILLFHAFSLSYEKKLHVNNDGRADRLDDELREKATQLDATAAAHGLKVPPFWRFDWWWPEK